MHFAVWTLCLSLCYAFMSRKATCKYEHAGVASALRRLAALSWQADGQGIAVRLPRILFACPLSIAHANLGRRTCIAGATFFTE